jgi:hypothetical protein
MKIKIKAYKDILILTSTEGLAVFEYRNLMWRLSKFATFGIGSVDVKISNDGADRPLSSEEKEILNRFYNRFDSFFILWKLRHLHSQAYLDTHQRNSLFAHSLYAAPAFKPSTKTTVLRTART